MPIRKCIAFGNNQAPTGDVSNAQNQNWLDDTGTTWVRLWAYWHQIQPDAPPAPMTTRLAELDANVIAARVQGKQVVLTTEGYPPNWVRKSSGVRPAGAADSNQAPEKFGVFDPWGLWIAFLIDRYGRTASNPSRWVEFLEVCNEPNLKVWPQISAPGGLPGAHCYAAQMMATAQVIQRDRKNRFGNTIRLAAPAVADNATVNDAHSTKLEDFVDDLLPLLSSFGFSADADFAWSQHNYADIERNRFSAPVSSTDYGSTVNRAALSRRKLRDWGGWTGWPSADPNNPGMLLTEGGVRLPKVGGDLNAQASTLGIFLINLAGNTNGIANGVGMLTYYLLWTDPNFDCGLCGPYPQGPRPAYSSWKGVTF